MATLYVAEFGDALASPDGIIQVVKVGSLITEQTVTYTGTAAASSAFNAGTKMVRIHTDAICSILFGTTPTATAAKMRLVAGQTEYFAVPLGGAFKVSAITNT